QPAVIAVPNRWARTKIQFQAEQAVRHWYACKGIGRANLRAAGEGVIQPNVEIVIAVQRHAAKPGTTLVSKLAGRDDAQRGTRCDEHGRTQCQCNNDRGFHVESPWSNLRARRIAGEHRLRLSFEACDPRALADGRGLDGGRART